MQQQSLFAPQTIERQRVSAINGEHRATPIVDLTTLRQYKKQFSFFETPGTLADKMADFIDPFRGVRILDPSVGLAALLKAVERVTRFDKQLDYCEVQEEFIPYLSAYNRVGSDFMLFNPGPVYDAVIMNPPYKQKLAEQHVDHAWDCTKRGGRVIALVGKNASLYLDDEYSGHVFHREEIKKGFTETSIDAYLFLIHKPLWA